MLSCSAFAVGCKDKTETPSSAEESETSTDSSDSGNASYSYEKVIGYNGAVAEVKIQSVTDDINGEQLKGADGTNYEFTVARASDEISSDNAVMNVQLTQYVSELILIKG